jgi:hypothetical protein
VQQEVSHLGVVSFVLRDNCYNMFSRQMWSSQWYWRDWLAAKSDLGRNCPVPGFDTRIFHVSVGRTEKRMRVLTLEWDWGAHAEVSARE